MYNYLPYINLYYSPVFNVQPSNLIVYNSTSSSTNTCPNVYLEKEWSITEDHVLFDAIAKFGTNWVNVSNEFNKNINVKPRRWDECCDRYQVLRKKKLSDDDGIQQSYEKGNYENAYDQAGISNNFEKEINPDECGTILANQNDFSTHLDSFGNLHQYATSATSTLGFNCESNSENCRATEHKTASDQFCSTMQSVNKINLCLKRKGSWEPNFAQLHPQKKLSNNVLQKNNNDSRYSDAYHKGAQEPDFSTIKKQVKISKNVNFSQQDELSLLLEGIPKSMNNNRVWTEEEDRMLLNAFRKHGENWEKVMEEYEKECKGNSIIFIRNKSSLIERYKSYWQKNFSIEDIKTKSDIEKDVVRKVTWWTPEEDQILLNGIRENSTKWPIISRLFETSRVPRTVMACKARYSNYWRKRGYTIQKIQSFKNNIQVLWNNMCESEIINEKINEFLAYMDSI